MPTLTRQVFSRVLDSWQFRQRVDDLIRRRMAHARFSDPRDVPLAAPPPDCRPRPAPANRTPGEGAIFITARFRTGSTLLWQLFNAMPGFAAFYEPLNERHAPGKRWDTPDPTHRGVSDYRQHYERVAPLTFAQAECWTYDNLYLDEGDRDPALADWISNLCGIDGATPVLQFNRVDFRLRWLRAQFPGAHVLHLYRHPRAQWRSMVGNRPLTWRTTMAEFAAHDGFYLLAWARDLSRIYPFLLPERHASPYALHYLLWRLSYAHGVFHADQSVGFEALMADVANVMGAVLTRAGRPQAPAVLATLRDYCSPPPPLAWTDFADATWFDDIEHECDRTLALAFESPTAGGG